MSTHRFCVIFGQRKWIVLASPLPLLTFISQRRFFTLRIANFLCVLKLSSFFYLFCRGVLAPEAAKKRFCCFSWLAKSKHARLDSSAKLSHPNKPSNNRPSRYSLKYYLYFILVISEKLQDISIKCKYIINFCLQD